MAQDIPFQEMGQTFAYTANGTSGTITVNQLSPSPQMRIVNSGNVTVFMNFGSAGGNTTAAVPSVGSPAMGIPLLPATERVFSGWQGKGSNVAIAFISPGANITSLIYITPGEGL